MKCNKCKGDIEGKYQLINEGVFVVKPNKHSKGKHAVQKSHKVYARCDKHFLK